MEVHIPRILESEKLADGTTGGNAHAKSKPGKVMLRDTLALYGIPVIICASRDVNGASKDISAPRETFPCVTGFLITQFLVKVIFFIPQSAPAKYGVVSDHCCCT